MQTRIATLFLGAALLLSAVSAGAQSKALNQYIEDIKGGDEIARMEARMWIPRFGLEAAPQLVALIDHESDAVWRAAKNTLADMANDAAETGNEEAQRDLTHTFMGMVGPSVSDRKREQGLRLLPIVIPEDYDVAPVAILLKDEQWREKARAALQEMQTPPARLALEHALDNGDAAFAVAILRALERLESPESVSALRSRLGHPDPAVRAAAAAALAWIGDPEYLSAYRRVVTQADDATRWEAWDASMRLADAMAANGGAWGYAIGVYREVLQECQNPILRGAALAGLGKHGNESVVPDIVNAVNTTEDGSLDGPALQAFRSLHGRAAEVALEQAYAQVPDRMKPGMIAVFGAKQSPRYLDEMEAALSGGDPFLAEKAFEALCESQLPEAAPLVVQFASSAPDEHKRLVVYRASKLALDYRDQGNSDAAGRAYLAVYRAAKSDEDRRFALEGIKEFPTPEAFEIVMEALGTEDVSVLPVATLAGVLKAMQEAGRTDDAERVRTTLFERLNSTDAVRDVMAIPGILGGPQETAKALGFITRWSVKGPVPWSLDGGMWESPAKGLEGFEGENVTLQAPGGDGIINLAGEYQQRTGTVPSNAAAYARAVISVPQAIEGRALMGSDDGIKLWINGEAVHENNVDRGQALDQDQAPIKLQAGENVIEAQITQGGGGWNFAVRLTGGDGAPLFFELVEPRE